MRRWLGLDPATYRRHAIHGEGRAYGQTNCYTDILVELLHSRGDEPLAVLGSIVRQDFEGDQFTFFKPPPGDVEALFGVDVHEMNPWRSIPSQAFEQLGVGRTMVIELDSYWLPDVAGTDYRANHVKSSVIVEAIDPGSEALVYWHNDGLFALSGEDFREVFRPGGLPPYCELVRFDVGPRLEGAALQAAAVALLAGHLARRPSRDPFAVFGERLTADLPELLEGDADGFHAYAFPTVRMAGAAAELLGDHLRWLFGADAPSESLGQVVDACKVLSFRLARRRAFDPAPIVADAAAGWDEALTAAEELVA